MKKTRFFSYLLLIKIYLISKLKNLNYFKKNKLQNYIDILKIDTVFDIGANIGQFSLKLYANGFSGRIISYEPMYKEYIILKKVSGLFKNWINYNIGIGKKGEKKSTIYVSENSVSSSILRVNQEHISAAPDSVQKKSIDINIQDLREAIEFNSINYDISNIFLKIDVQGYEIPIIDNFDFSQYQIPLLLVEASFRKLYSEQESFEKLIELIYKNNYIIVEILDCFRGKGHLKPILQADILCCHKAYINRI
tara:strand:+ start:2901 stop:3653 length:753 start_codon:yes stop_codon:yes gene_type:complete